MEQTAVVKAAKIVSVLGHPFVLLALTVLAATASKESPARAAIIGLITVTATVLPMLFIIRRKVKSGKWSDHDVSDAAQRRSFYPIMMAILALALTVFFILDFPRPLLAGMLISLAILLVAMFVNRYSKISLHLSFAVYFALSLFAVSFRTGTIFLIFAAGVGWSRVRLARHSTPQVLSGALLGAIAGIAFLKTVGFF